MITEKNVQWIVLIHDCLIYIYREGYGILEVEITLHYLIFEHESVT